MKYKRNDMVCPKCGSDEVYIETIPWSQGFGKAFGWEGCAKCEKCGYEYSYSESYIEEEDCLDHIIDAMTELIDASTELIDALTEQ